MQNTELKTILKGEHIGRIGISQTNWMRYVDKNLSDEKYLEENIHLVFEVGTGIDTQDFSLDHHFPFINHSFMTMNVDEVSHVEVPDSRNMVVHFKNNDEFTLYDISEHDYNEILCWVTVNKLKA